MDTPSDYQFMAEVYRRWYASHPDESIVALPWVIEQLQQDQHLAGINANVRQKAVGDVSLSALLVCHAGSGVGLGHLSRAIAVSRALQDAVFAGVRILIQGDQVARKALDLIPHRYVASDEPFPDAVRREVLAKRPDVVLFDIHSRWITPDLLPLFAELKAASIRLVAIDSLLEYCDEFDLTLVPSFFVEPNKVANCHRSLLYGWEYYLLPKPEPRGPWSSGNKALVLTGGSDATNLGQTLPEALDGGLPIGTEVHWVQGPFAEPPRVPAAQRLRWVVHKAPEGLGPLMARANYALTVYGVSFFELLQHGIPTVVFSPYGGKD